QEELEVHREVLELLLLGVRHDRPGVGVLLDVEPLLVPVDRLGLLDQGLDHPREGPRLRRELFRWLVVGVEAHRRILHNSAATPDATTSGWPPRRRDERPPSSARSL